MRTEHAQTTTTSLLSSLYSMGNLFFHEMNNIFLNISYAADLARARHPRPPDPEDPESVGAVLDVR